jgi:regulator of protease activity HflC (stomatin/prohibitin superfamily)
MLRRFKFYNPTPKYTRGFFRVVDQNYVAYREFLGTNRIQLNPGIRLKLPIVHNFQAVDMREQPISIKEISCYTQDNVPVKIGGTLFFKINDAEKALYGVSNYMNSMHEVGMSAVRSIVGKNDYDTMIRDRNNINKHLYEIVLDSIRNWGINCTKFEITAFGPQNNEVAKKLELQMEAERSRRENELNTRARVNTAEGEKQKIILDAEGKKESTVLESEGKLASAKNNAEGEFILQQRVADGKAYEIEKTAHALATQLRQISDIVGPSDAANFLLKQQEYEAVKAIAEGPNAKVYFMPNNLNNQNNQPFMPILDSASGSSVPIIPTSYQGKQI